MLWTGDRAGSTVTEHRHGLWRRCALWAVPAERDQFS
ncbi:hypothetical protein GZL_06861 [Streptomyces sp. 769]|nr:hypothetical protein GZL_06861 [Streptomyces sp. 769]